MIDIPPEYLRSRRTLSASEVDAEAASRARYDLTPGERQDNVTSRTYNGGSEH